MAGIALVGLTVASLLGSNEALEFAPSFLSESFLNSPLALLSLATTLFVGKAILTLILTRTATLFVAKVEVTASRQISANIFSRSLENLKETSQPELEWAILRSTGLAFGTVLLNLMALTSELSLTLVVFTVMLAADWSATLLLGIYFLVVLLVFQFYAQATYSGSGEIVASGTVTVSQAITDFVDSYREITASQKSFLFLEEIGRSREAVARAGARANFFQTIPRVLLESALILGAFGFLGFELLRTGGEPNYPALGVLLLGALRAMSALLPLQRAYSELVYVRPQAEAAQKLLEQHRNPVPDYELTEKRQWTESSGPSGTAEPPSIRFANVDFRYKSRTQHSPQQALQEERWVLKSVSLDALAGSCTGIIGPSGSGKSTFVDLLLGLLTPTSGNISINNVSPDEFFRVNPGLAGYVPQKPGLVSGSILRNIALGEKGESIDRGRAWSALRQSRLEDFVESLPDGVDSDLGPHADALSGGQRQRLGLARALYSNPKLLILDEATSALDAEMESTIVDEILGLKGEITLVIVAHRLSTIQKADQVILLDAGQVLATGTFEELRNTEDFVRRYVGLQSLD